jgi:hypothetical protein
MKGQLWRRKNYVARTLVSFLAPLCAVRPWAGDVHEMRGSEDISKTFWGALITPRKGCRKQTVGKMVLKPLPTWVAGILISNGWPESFSHSEKLFPFGCNSWTSAWTQSSQLKTAPSHWITKEGHPAPARKWIGKLYFIIINWKFSI